MPAGEIIDLAWKFIVPALTMFVGMGLWALTRHYQLTNLRLEHEKLLREKNEAEGKLDETRRRNEETRQIQGERYDRLAQKYRDAYTKFYGLKRSAIELKARVRELEARPDTPAPPDDEFTTPGTSAAELEAQLAAAQQELHECRTRIDEATRTDGRIWLRTPMGSIPKFRPRDQRQCTVISVLNLKGGVGKTTITANLAATLAAKNSRCLLLDLDFQRSLSMLMVPNKDRKLLHFGQKTVQHFLAGDDHSSSRLLQCRHELDSEAGGCSIITNSDSRSGSSGADGLEETESRLMVEWLFDRERPDPRFFLRQALHERAVGDAYRYVFLDCPPRLTTACVNALAACDFVIIPVVPDPISIRAAENLLTSLQSLRSVVCPNLHVLAVIPNMVRFHGPGPIKAQADALASLRGALKERWPEPISICDSSIRYDSEFGIAAAKLDVGEDLHLATRDPKVKVCFQNLAKELIREMQHHDSRHAAAVPA